MDQSVHEQTIGDGDYEGWSYLTLNFIVRGNTPEETLRRALAFSERVGKLVEDNPLIEDCKSMSDCIAALTLALEMAESGE